MLSPLTVLETTRKNILSLADAYTEKQLNTIPEGFNNNLIWNMGHILVTQQLLCYRLSGVDCYTSNEVIDAFRKGSKPTKEVDSRLINEIKTSLQEMVSKTKKDVDAGVFKEFKTYKTSYGVTLASFEDALYFNNVHEGMHLGFMLALKKHL